VEQGFRVIKLKLGTAPWPEERARLGRALARLPASAALRLDANGAWQADQAAAAVADLARMDGGLGRIESLEEPLQRPDDRLLASLQAAAPFPLALDESLARRTPLDPQRLPVRRLVLKPPVLGGLRATLDLALRALAAEREVVLTSLVESAAGLWTTAQLAAAIPSALAHGLDTADWLREDLGTPPRPADGWIALPDSAGSGFTPWHHIP
jgi:L-alanine-DL-glutamate epimerase-like enolase superfamily enzyme